MTAAVFFAEDLAADRILLTGTEGHHAATVRRLRVGEAVELVDGRGLRATCTVSAVARDVVELDVVGRTTEPVPSPRLLLVQALAKGDRGELAVELATEVGIDEIVPWSAARSVVKWDGQRGIKALLRWRVTAREAAKQSRRARFPAVVDVETTAQVADRVRGAACALVLHEDAEQPLADVVLPVVGDVLLVVGPEGGITAEEVTLLEAAGAVAVRLGPTILRTSTAGAAAAAVVSARTPRWR